MKILNFGSINIDHVYKVDHFVQPGETLNSEDYKQYAGGKGFNQSIAIARAGGMVFHAGKIGPDGVWLKDRLKGSGVDTTFVETIDAPTGHAVIQVDLNGENAIFLFGGANQKIITEDAENVFKNFSKDDYLLLQNEISAIPDILRLGRKTGMRIVFNPAPMEKDILSYPLDVVDFFILNAIEGKSLTGENNPEKILTELKSRYQKTRIVLTLGKKGVLYSGFSKKLHVPAEIVSPVDTTAAGDTFIGYFLTDIINGRRIETALATACKAAAHCITRPGAAESIPLRTEL